MNISETQFFIDRTDPSGLQEQLRQKIVTAILHRRFPPGARMPATRRLATYLGVARITVTLVYQELVSDGYLDSRARSGVFVSDDPPGLLAKPESERTSAVDWQRRLGSKFQDLAIVRKPEDWRLYRFPFLYGQVDEALFPHNEWRDCARRALGRREFHDIAADSSSRDDPQIVAYTLSHSLPARGVEANHDELLITLGAQNGLWLAAEALTKGLGGGSRGLKVAVEEPCYPELRDILRFAGAEVIPAPVDGDGLDPETLPKGLDLVCIAPSHHTPTGATMSDARRRLLLKRAREERFVILEDDYDFEMSFLRPPSPALKALDRDGRVIYVGSYSKPLFPGLRLGYLAAPAPLIRAARALRSLSMRHPPGMTQRTVAHFLALGHYNAHVARLRREFSERRAVMAAALDQHGFKPAEVATHGGSSFWVETPNGIDSRELSEKARALGVLIEAGDVFYADRRSTPFFRIAYSSIPRERIEEGVALLAEAARSA